MLITRKFLLGISLVLLTHIASAAVVLTSDRSTVGPGYTVDWGTLGGDMTSVTPGSALGGLHINGASGFTVFSGGTYNADFLSGDSVLALFDLNVGDVVDGTFDLTFDSAVLSAGAQVQGNAYTSFSGFISAYDTSNLLLGKFAVSGNNAGNGDGSAVFAGIQSDSFNIKRLVFSDFGPGAAINELSVGNVLVNDVPEPGSLALFMTALGLFAGVVRRRRS